jgi:hypothetical protein
MSQVAAQPDVWQTCSQVRLAVDRLQVEDEEHLVKGVILVREQRYPSTYMLMRWKLDGCWKPCLPSRGCLSYGDHVTGQGTCGLFRCPRITLLNRGGGSACCGLLLALEARTQATVARILPQSEASRLREILLRVKAGVSKGVQEDFSAAGPMHIRAISGFNLSQSPWPQSGPQAFSGIWVQTRGGPELGRAIEG